MSLSKANFSSKIEETRNFVVSEGKNMNQARMGFQSKYMNKLKELGDKTQKQQDDQTDMMNKGLSDVANKNNKIEKLIKLEKEDRIRYMESQLKPILAGLTGLDKLLENERIQKKKKTEEILNTIKSESTRMFNEIQHEDNERKKKVGSLTYDTQYELKDLRKFDEDFGKKTDQEFDRVEKGIKAEMDNRFDHQDRIVGDLSSMMRAFQNTLKVLSNDV